MVLNLQQEITDKSIEQIEFYMNHFNNILTKTEILRTFKQGGGGLENLESGGGGGSAGHLQAIYYWEFFKQKLQNFTEKKEGGKSWDHP